MVELNHLVEGWGPTPMDNDEPPPNAKLLFVVS